MRVAELLTAIASWLESPHNEALMLAEDHEDCMKVVAESCVLAAQLLKTAADEVDLLEPAVESVITPESIEETAALASALDAVADPQLKKMASVLDELLLTIAAPKEQSEEQKAYSERRIEELRRKYQGNAEMLHKINRTDEQVKDVDKSKMTKHFELHDRPLNARNCPQHPGAQLARVGEHQYQCEIDKKIYNWLTGYTLDDGTKVPGGDVSLQTQNLHTQFHSLFDDREGRLSNHT
jgi:hypothetical protein